MTEKIYVPKASAKEVKFSNGGSMLKLSFKAEDVMAFIRQHTNAKGYINLNISPRRDVGKYGETHSVYLDTYQPKPKADDSDVPF